MSDIHPREVELARFGDGELYAADIDRASADIDRASDVAEHLRWCARCRSVVADHRWLQEEIKGALMEAADAVDVSRPKWWAVQAQIRGERLNAALSRRASAVFSVVVACCMMLCVSPALGQSVSARTAPPEPVTAPPPVAAIVSDVSGEATLPGGPLGVEVTPTPELPRMHGRTRERCPQCLYEPVPLLRTPAPMLPPTPLEPGA